MIHNLTHLRIDWLNHCTRWYLCLEISVQGTKYEEADKIDYNIARAI